MELILHTDGGARGNPGPAAAGVVIRNNNNEIIKELGKFLGTKTNNEAEYIALYLGLASCIALGGASISCFLDSELIVKQLKGEYKVKSPGLKPYYEKVLDLSKKFSKISYTHVPRAKNAEADKLVNEVLDAQ
ncbi:MAG: ribonuclease HI family protein [Patescibacteria group bacterium]